ncbi:MAG: ABC transporter permease [Planctomycetota bacterium]|nr:ABC transporter permease [Planctomycetota bacterium]
MLTFILRRLLQALPVMAGIVLVCFALLKLSGDPTRILAGERAPDYVRENIRKKWRLDEPWPKQLAFFVGGLVSGELKSYTHERPVGEMLLEGASVTLRLALGAILVAVVLGLLSGIFSAYRPRSALDYAAATGASIGISIPAFWLAMILTLIFGVKLGWFPIGSYKAGRPEYLAIPIATLGLITTALIARLSRSCLLESLSQDYVRTARAKGLSEVRALLGHAFPNALVPIVTVIGTNLAGLMTGAVLTETTCSLPGLGRVIYNAINSRDHPVILGGCLFFALVFVLVNLAVDILYGVLDPRIRHE